MSDHTLGLILGLLTWIAALLISLALIGLVVLVVLITLRLTGG